MADTYPEGRNDRATKADVLKPGDLVERLKELNPDLAGQMSDKRLGTIVRSILQAVAAEVNARNEGRLRVAGLGSINIRQIEREKDGEVVQLKRVTLRPDLPEE